MATDPYLVLVGGFVADLRERLRYADQESREALLVEPLRDLVRGLAHLDGRDRIDLRGQTQEPGIGRPDFSVKDGPTLVGHIETKPPGKGADPSLFRGDDKQQWGRYQRLPNLLYTDGFDFALYQSGTLALIGERPARVHLGVGLGASGNIEINSGEAGQLAAIIGLLVGWQPVPPRSLRALADRLAPLCATLRDAVGKALNNASSSVAHVTRDVRASLFPEASDQDLADAYAQTCTYSMLLARSEGASNLQTASIERALRAGHPVLARVVRVLLDPEAEDEIAWAVELVRRQVEVVDLDRLRQSGQDTWLYFYERFLAAYDPKLREDRGVYYTPKEVIATQVALADEILRQRFQKPLGFAAEEVTVLDPSAGTGSYPLAVIEAAARSAAPLGHGAVAAAVAGLAERLHAFELLVGPYSVAHLRLTEAIRSHEGTTPIDGVRVYLTDTLASPDIEPPILGAALDPLVAEQRRARTMKSETPVVVCLGNPPYDREAQEAGNPHPRKGGWVRFGDPGQTRPILRDFVDPLTAAGLGEHAKNLYNDYVYFWRWAMWKTFERHPAETVRTGGIITFISAASYLSGPGFAFMRKRLRDFCDDIYIIDLGGYALGARPTENVFAIKTPVAIAVAVRDAGDHDRAGRVWYADWSAGSKDEKLARLAQVTGLDQIDWRPGPVGPTAPFVAEPEGEYATWPLLGDLFPWRHSGAQLKRTWPVAPSPTALEARWERLVASTSVEELRGAFAGPAARLAQDPPPLLENAGRRSPLTDLLDADPQKRAAARVRGEIVPFEAKSFDRQWIIRDERLGDRMRPTLWQILGPHQLFLSTLMTSPLSNGPGATVATVSPPDLHYFRGSLGGADLMPLYRDAAGREPNVIPSLLDQLAESFGRAVSPEDLFAYVVGVMGTSAYTDRFRAELTVAGPRLPVTRDPDLFQQLAERGRRLVFLHSRGERMPRDDWTMPNSEAQITAPIPTSVQDCPREVFYDDDEHALRIGVGEIKPVRSEVWNFSVSGYLVVQEWIGWRLAGRRPGHSRSPLDDLRPLRWDFETQRELLQLIAIIEEITFELTPACAVLLDQVVVGEAFHADELPQPTQDQREEPRLPRGSRRRGAGAVDPSQRTLR